MGYLRNDDDDDYETHKRIMRTECLREIIKITKTQDSNDKKISDIKKQIEHLHLYIRIFKMAYGLNDGNWEEDTWPYLYKAMKKIKETLASESSDKLRDIQLHVEECERGISEMTRNGSWTPRDYKL